MLLQLKGLMPLVMVMLFQSDFSDWFVWLRAGDEGGGGGGLFTGM